MDDRMSNETAFRIIVIDDNPDIHRDFIKILTTQDSASDLDKISMKIFGKISNECTLPDFEIDTASQGQEGVEKVKQKLQDECPYSLAFVDIRMPPGWDGIETIKRIWELDSDIQVVICTAYSDYSWEETVAHLGKKDNLLILKKPFDAISVRQLACALTKKWQMLQDSRRFTSTLKQQVTDRTLSLQKSLSLVKATLDSSDEGIIVISNDGNIIDYNQKFCAMWDVTADMIENHGFKSLQAFMQNQINDSSTFVTWMKSLQESPDVASIDVIKLKNEKIFDCYSQPQKLNNKIVGRVLNFRDITERSKLEKELEHQAKHDHLTELPNRVLLMEKIHDAINASEMNNNSFAVMFLDLDRFKLINDSLSHSAGDDLLRDVAKRLLSVLNGNGILARLGGDEFVILITNVKSRDEISLIASSIIHHFQQPFTISERQVTITASVGISVFPDDGRSIDTLLRNADVAMYKVKETGSNNFKFYSSEMNDKSLEKLDNEMRLRQAIIDNELFLCYQPQYDVINEKLIAVEALLRWLHPEKGIVLPIDFVPLAEETGLIVPIGEWVMRTACKQCKVWIDAGYPKIRIAVNITAQQLKQTNIVEVIKSILTETQLDPSYLELELTENIIISSIEVLRSVTALKELGVTIAIDDFGTGYSSLSYLKNLPLDRLKIDGSLVQHIKSAGDDEVIIRAIIAVAKNLNLDVLAEGVETQNQLDFLKKQKCDEIQGFYLSKPLSSSEMEELLQIENKKLNVTE